jgi:O-antigen/teichoic acid export membrane protein
MLPSRPAQKTSDLLLENTAARLTEASQGLPIGARAGVWTLVDQGVFTASNFLFQMLLARWLAPQDYGAFTVALAIFLLLGAGQIALFGEPLLVYGAREYHRCLPAYLGALFYWHRYFAALSGGVVLCIGAGLKVAGYDHLSTTVLMLGLCTPAFLFLWLLRSAYYLYPQQLSVAARGGVLYLILIVGGASVLSHYDWLSAVSGLGVMALASLGAGAWLWMRLPVVGGVRQPGDFLGEVWSQHRQYGRWSLATYVFTWIPENVYYLLLSWHGLEASAALRAALNFLVPISRVGAALSPLLIAALARLPDARKHRTMRQLSGVFTMGALLYGGGLLFFFSPLLSWLYNGQYTEDDTVAWLLAGLALCLGSVTVPSAMLRALARPECVFWAQAISAAVTLTLGVGLTAAWGVKGAIMGFCLSAITATLAMEILYRQVRRPDAL